MPAICFLISLGFISYGIYIFRGPVSFWLIDSHHWGYGFIPFGIAFFFWGIGAMPFWPQTFQCIFFGFSPVIIFASFFIPKDWIDPDWLKWLKKEYPFYMSAIQQEIEQVGYLQWNARFKTREDLENWILKREGKKNE